MSRIYLDTNVYIYYLEQDPQFGMAARAVFTCVENPQHELYASLYTLGELLVAPVRRDDPFTAATFRRFFLSANVTLVAFSPKAAAIYAHLRGHRRVKPLDALHLACASVAGIDLFVTNDLSLVGMIVPEIGAIVGLDASF